MRSSRATLLAAALLWLVPTAAAAADGPLVLRYVAVSGAHVAFDYAGDIWLVGREGGAARPLVASPAEEGLPVFSPDGSRLAFARRAGANWDVYVAEVAGGEPRRLTFHPSIDLPQGWSRDGRDVLFSSHRSGWFGAESRLFTIPAGGGFARELPLADAGAGSFSPDGERIAYTSTPFLPEVFFWRGYRGGMTQTVRIASLAGGGERAVTAGDSNAFCPSWVGERLYFISDRDGTYNVYAYDTKSGAVVQLTRHERFDVVSASADAGGVVYVRDGALHALDPATGRTREIPVRLEGPFPEREPRRVPAAKFVRSVNVHPDGGRALVVARGEIFLAEAGGRATNLTSSPGVFERAAKWSPDGQSFAYLSDESGEDELCVRPAAGGAARRVRIEPAASFYGELTWSPDSRRIALSHRELALVVVDLDTGRTRAVDSTRYAYGDGAFQAAWSPDGRWLAYVKHLPNRLRGVFVYSLETGERRLVTDGRGDAQGPAFDTNGKYLYFSESRNAGLVSYGMSAMPFEKSVTRAWRVMLLDAAAPLPAAPAGPGSPAPGSPAPGSPAPGSPAPAAVRIDFDDIGRRVWPIAERPATTVDRRPRLDLDALKFGEVTVEVDPPAEWRALYREAWRVMREYFYDERLRGEQWAALEAKYAEYLPNLATREDLNRLLRSAFWHVSVSHVNAYGGDAPPGPQGESAGLLGADYRVEHGRYRVARVYRGDNSTRSLEGPLARPGALVGEGEYVLAVDGEELTAAGNIHAMLAGKAETPVRLRVGPRPDGGGSREVTVVPLADESALRQFAWAERNRERVEQLSGGRLAYVYLADTGRAGYEAFNREFYAQLDKRGLILDARYNGGGVSADYVIDVLRRAPLFSVALRGVEPLPIPVGALSGPKVLLANEYSRSGGDSLPYMFRAAGLGPIVGRRTMGAGVGAASHDLADNGQLFVPDWGHYEPETGRMTTENRGVAPDVEVEVTNEQWRAGRDGQLEAAVRLALEKLESGPAPATNRR